MVCVGEPSKSGARIPVTNWSINSHNRWSASPWNSCLMFFGLRWSVTWLIFGEFRISFCPHSEVSNSNDTREIEGMFDHGLENVGKCRKQYGPPRHGRFLTVSMRCFVIAVRAFLVFFGRNYPWMCSITRTLKYTRVRDAYMHPHLFVNNDRCDESRQSVLYPCWLQSVISIAQSSLSGGGYSCHKVNDMVVHNEPFCLAILAFLRSVSSTSMYISM